MSGPPAKKRRTDLTDAAPAHIDVSRLARHEVTLAGCRTLSPGAHHSSRIAVAALPGQGAEQYDVYVASGRTVYSVSVPRAAAFGGARGKEGVHIAEAAAGVQGTPLDAIQHRAEVQHVAVYEQGGGESVIASVDCYGRAVVAAARRVDGHPGLQITGVQQLQPTDLLREAGWAGVALAPGQPSQAAVARHFAKDVTIFDGSMAVHTIHTMYRPTAVQLLSTQLAASPGGSPLVAVTEGPQLSIWDVRASKRGARVARLSPAPHQGHLLCMAVSDDGGLALIGAAGDERSVLVWEPRKWTPLDRWSNCLKYELTSLHFSSGNPRLCYVAGLDYEVLCGEWSGNKSYRLGGGNRSSNSTHTGLKTGCAAVEEAAPGGDATDAPAGLGRGVSFRGDSRWMGLAKAAGQDVLAGMTQSRQLYVAEFSAS